MGGFEGGDALSHDASTQCQTIVLQFRADRTHYCSSDDENDDGVQDRDEAYLAHSRGESSIQERRDEVTRGEGGVSFLEESLSENALLLEAWKRLSAFDSEGNAKIEDFLDKTAVSVLDDRPYEQPSRCAMKRKKTNEVDDYTFDDEFGDMMETFSLGNISSRDNNADFGAIFDSRMSNHQRCTTTFATTSYASAEENRINRCKSVSVDKAFEYSEDSISELSNIFRVPLHPTYQSDNVPIPVFTCSFENTDPRIAEQPEEAYVSPSALDPSGQSTHYASTTTNSTEMNAINETDTDNDVGTFKNNECRGDDRSVPEGHEEILLGLEGVRVKVTFTERDRPKGQLSQSVSNESSFDTAEESVLLEAQTKKKPLMPHDRSDPLVPPPAAETAVRPRNANRAAAHDDVSSGQTLTEKSGSLSFSSEHGDGHISQWMLYQEVCLLPVASKEPVHDLARVISSVGEGCQANRDTLDFYPFTIGTEQDRKGDPVDILSAERSEALVDNGSPSNLVFALQPNCGHESSTTYPKNSDKTICAPGSQTKGHLLVSGTRALPDETPPSNKDDPKRQSRTCQTEDRHDSEADRHDSEAEINTVSSCLTIASVMSNLQIAEGTVQFTQRGKSEYVDIVSIDQADQSFDLKNVDAMSVIPAASNRHEGSKSQEVGNDREQHERELLSILRKARSMENMYQGQDDSANSFRKKPKECRHELSWTMDTSEQIPEREVLFTPVDGEHVAAHGRRRHDSETNMCNCVSKRGVHPSYQQKTKRVRKEVLAMRLPFREWYSYSKRTSPMSVEDMHARKLREHPRDGRQERRLGRLKPGWLSVRGLRKTLRRKRSDGKIVLDSMEASYPDDVARCGRATPKTVEKAVRFRYPLADVHTYTMEDAQEDWYPKTDEYQGMFQYYVDLVTSPEVDWWLGLDPYEEEEDQSIEDRSGCFADRVQEAILSADFL